MTETTVEYPFVPPGPAKHYDLELPTHHVPFTGWLLGHSTTKFSSASVRWTTMDLYRIENPKTATAYILMIVGHSVLYHLPDRDCTSGSGADYYVHELPADARPCSKCVGRTRLDPQTEVVYEQEFLNLYECKTPAEVVRNLLNNSRGGGRDESRAGSVGRQAASQPALDLLDEVREHDAAFLPEHVEVRL